MASLFFLCLINCLLIHLQGFRGILNSTTNVILSEMENGLSFAESLKKAQALGIAETDATHDIEGWDAAVKTAALITVLMDVPVRLEKMEREGIRGLSGEAVRAARKEGRPYKLVCRARKTESGVAASVGPEQIPLTDPMAQVSGASSYIYFETGIFPASPSPRESGAVCDGLWDAGGFCEGRRRDPFGESSASGGRLTIARRRNARLLSGVLWTLCFALLLESAHQGLHFRWAYGIDFVESYRVRRVYGSLRYQRPNRQNPAQPELRQ